MYSCKIFSIYPLNYNNTTDFQNISLAYVRKGLSTCIQMFKLNDNIWTE